MLIGFLILLIVGGGGCVQATPPGEGTIRFLRHEPEYWVDNFLSSTQKDTLQVRLWSDSRQRFLDSIPDPASMETTMDWDYWFVDNKVEAVLFLKGKEQLRIPDAIGLYYCSVLEEDGRRAVAIVPCFATVADIIHCDIYALGGGGWEPFVGFSTSPSYFYDEESAEKEWLVRKDGRWMYRDYLNSIKGEDTTLHYVFY